jgi:hypothetical protein
VIIKFVVRIFVGVLLGTIIVFQPEKQQSVQESQFPLQLKVAQPNIKQLEPQQSGSQNALALQKLLSNAQQKNSQNKKVNIYLPQGKYTLGESQQKTVFLLPSNTTIHAEKTELSVKGNVVFLGIPTTNETSGVTNFEWNGGVISGDGDKNTAHFTLVEGKNNKFINLTLENTTAFGNHAFDLNATSGVLIQNMKFIGYGNRQLTKKDLTDNAHQYKAEAVQLDTNSKGSLSRFEREIWQKVSPLTFKHRQSAVTSNVQIRQSSFLPNVVSGKQITSAQNPLGQHGYDPKKKMASQNIIFENNRVIDPVGGPVMQNKKEKNNYQGALHFNAVQNMLIANNYFLLNRAQYAMSFYTSDKTSPTHKVTISKNKIMSLHATPYVLVRTSTKTSQVGKINIVVSQNILLNSHQKIVTGSSSIAVDQLHRKTAIIKR